MRSPFLSYARDGRAWFLAIFALFAALLPISSQRFGITYDEPVHQRHGEILLDYFEGRSRDAQANPIPGFENMVENPGSSLPLDHPGWHKLNLFGGFFDLVCAFVQRHLSALGTYESRHLINSLFGVLCILATGLLARELAGSWGAGSLAMVIIGLSPRVFGDSMNNPKDLPFAAMNVLGLWLLARFAVRLPRIQASTAVALTAVIALSIDIRVSGLLLIAYLAGATLLFLATRIWLRSARMGGLAAEGADRLRGLGDHRELWAVAGAALVIGVAGYLYSALLWPWAHTRPLTAPVDAMRLLSHFDVFDSFGLFRGQWLHRWEIPRSYALVWTWITIPPAVTLGIFLIPLHARRSPAATAIIATSALFPLAYVAAMRSNLYDGGRHLLFVIPPLAALCACGWDALLERFGRMQGVKYRVGLVSAALVLAVCLLEPALWMARNHPHEAFYFSPVIGGIKGAFKRYEIDYWGSSLRSAVEWIVANVPPGTADKPVRVWVYYGEVESTKYWLEKHPGYQYVQTPEASPDWDYSILLPAAAKHNHALLANWPPGGTIHQIEAGGVPLNAIIRNRRSGNAGTVRAWGPMTEDEWVNESLLLYREGKMEESIAAARQAIALNPRNAIAYNNLGAAHAMLQQWDEAVAACETALAIDPSFQLARDNYAWARDGSAKLKKGASMKRAATP